jgi:Putative peptidoglycan binding domain
MAGRDSQRDAAADDWFAEPEEPAGTRREREPAMEDAVHGMLGSSFPEPGADDWLSDEEARTAQEGLLGAWIGLIDRRVAIVLTSLAVLLVAALAAGGVFTGSSPRPTTLPAPTVTPPTTTTTASTPVAQVPYPSATLKPGDRGAQVTTLQRALASLGFSPGKVDGDYGAGTQSAVSRFQRFNHLTSDGVLGPATLRALVNALRGP